jgi:hypothetical protein
MSSVKGNMSKSTKHCTYDLYFMTVAFKYAEIETTKLSHWFYVNIIICRDSKTGWNVIFMHYHYSTGGWKVKSSSEKQVFFTAKVLILQEVSITLQDSANKMSLYFSMLSSYIHHRWYQCKICCHKNIWLSKDTSDFSVNWVETPYVTTTLCDV